MDLKFLKKKMVWPFSDTTVSVCSYSNSTATGMEVLVSAPSFSWLAAVLCGFWKLLCLVCVLVDKDQKCSREAPKICGLFNCQSIIFALYFCFNLKLDTGCGFLHASFSLLAGLCSCMLFPILALFYFSVREITGGLCHMLQCTSVLDFLHAFQWSWKERYKLLLSSFFFLLIAFSYR